MILRLVRLGVLLFLLGLALPIASALSSPTCADLAARGETYGQALVLSARAGVRMGLGPQSRARTLAAVDLYQGGAVSRLIMTGHATGMPNSSAAAMMADLAIAEGVPASSVAASPTHRRRVWRSSCAQAWGGRR